MYYLYILQSRSTGPYYIGQTQDIDERLRRYNSGGCRATRGRGPWEVVYSRSYASRSEAMAAERGLKRAKSRRVIEALIAGNV